jgi:hypothetical protein|eukprot:SAG25_NODE_302_length_10160_cov_3.981413_5_plen_80_part_00
MMRQPLVLCQACWDVPCVCDTMQTRAVERWRVARREELAGVKLSQLRAAAAQLEVRNSSLSTHTIIYKKNVMYRYIDTM